MSSAPKQLVFLVEEATKEEFLRTFLPRLGLGGDVNVVMRVAEGHTDLRLKIPTFMNAWAGYDRQRIRFLVFCDQDSAACKTRKQELFEAIPLHWRQQAVVRIVCREMERWYLGDGGALEDALPMFGGRRAERLLRRDPDHVKKPAEAIRKVARFGKTSLARKMGASVNWESNRSGSLQQFVGGLERVLEELHG